MRFAFATPIDTYVIDTLICKICKYNMTRNKTADFHVYLIIPSIQVRPNNCDKGQKLHS